MNKDKLKYFECALASDNHFIVEPIPLTNCGHCVCKCCLIKAKSPLKCNICGVITDQDLSNAQSPMSIKIALESCVDDILKILEGRISSRLETLRDNVNKEREIIESKVKYIEEEIDIRVESIKIQLDEVSDNLKAKLNSIRTEMLGGSLKTINGSIHQYDEILSDLKNNIASSMKQTEEQISINQKHLKQLDILLNSINWNALARIDFMVSETQLNDDILGKFVYYREDNIKVDVKDMVLNASHFHTTNLNFKLWDVLVLPDNKLICVNREAKQVDIFDHEFKHVQTIKDIGLEDFSPTGITMNHKMPCFYLSEYKKIIMVDTNFTVINSVKLDDTIFGITYANGVVYACNRWRSQIDFYGESLEFQGSLGLDFGPWLIKVSDRTICIESDSPPGIYFYSLDDFQLKYKYNNNHCRISMIDGLFFEVNSWKKAVCCYDKDGVLVDEVNNELLNSSITKSWDGSLVKFYGKLIVTSYDDKKVTIISK